MRKNFSPSCILCLPDPQPSRGMDVIYSMRKARNTVWGKPDLTLDWCKAHKSSPPIVKKFPGQSFQLKCDDKSRFYQGLSGSPCTCPSVCPRTDRLQCRERRHHWFLFFQHQDSSKQRLFWIKQKPACVRVWAYLNNIYFSTGKTTLDNKKSSDYEVRRAG